MHTSNKKTSIVGAGLVGSLLAVLLAKRGYQVDVYERRGDMRKAGFIGGRSINLALSNRGWKALEKAGIDEAIRQSAIPMTGRIMHNVKGELTYQAYGKKNQAIWSVSRGGLNLELIKIAASHSHVQFHFDERCEGIDLDTGTVQFSNTQTGHRQKIESSLVFGTDGAFSAIRSSLQRRPRFNYSQHYLEHGYKELTIPPTADGDFRMDKNALHIWPRRQFMLIALPNPDGSFTCTLFLPFEGTHSFENLQTDAQVLAFFNEHFSDAVPLIPDLLNDFRENPTSTLVTVRCSPWIYNNRFLLLGDASHAIVPFYGQGMNSGFEDCTLLDELIEQHSDDWKSTLQEFNANRIPDANAIAELALRNFIEMRDLVGDPNFLLRKKIEAWLHEKYPDRFIPLYSMVTFSHLPYREALQAGKRQDQLFERILALDNIQENWQSEAVESLFLQWFEGNSRVQ